MTIHEPMTFATDLLLATATAWFGGRLWQLGGRNRQHAMRLWGAGLVVSALAALSGGWFHALGPAAPALVRGLLWKTTVYAIGLAGLLLVHGAARAALTTTARRCLGIAVGVQLVVYGVWMVYHDAFRYVIYDYAPLLLVILLLQGMSWHRWRDRAAPWLAAGVGTAVLAALCQLLRVTPSAWFNYNDLYHMLQLLGFWFFYRGGLLLRDRID